MVSVLNEICARKREHIARQKETVSLAALKERAAGQSLPRGFMAALKAKAATNTPPLIAEIKKASPSKGVLREDFDPAQIARIYESGGAACLSVLTDEPYFQGRDAYLEAVKQAVSLPLLRKDFMLDPYQIYESRALGADCVLLIMAALGDSQAHELYTLSTDLGMDVLVEVHDREELARAKKLSPAMVGINNRNLKTLVVNVQTSFDLAKDLPTDCLKISESGLADTKTLQSLQATGFTGFLIGESLIREADIAGAMHKLLGGT